MKKILVIIFSFFIFSCGRTLYAQQKPSERALNTEILKVKEKQLLRNKMVNQNQQQITENKNNQTVISQSSEKDQQGQQKPVHKSSAQPVKIPERSRKQE